MIYAINSCFLRNVKLKKYVTEVLIKFAQENSLRVGIDQDMKAIDIYRDIAQENPIVASWLTLMSFEPNSFQIVAKITEPITSETQFFLAICKSIVNNKCLIVDTIQNFNDFNIFEKCKLEYCGTTIRLIEKDDAVEELSSKSTAINNQITGSIVAMESSRIIGAKNG